MKIIGIGDHTRFGATRHDQGWNVAVRAPKAIGVELCVVTGGDEETISLHGPLDGVFHGTVTGLEVGQEYGFRVHGPWDPRNGVRCDPSKLLIDPYARAVTGSYDGDHSTLSMPHPGSADSGPQVPRGVVTDPDRFATTKPRVPWEDTVIYEAHVRNLTMRHPAVPPEHQGLFLGAASDAIIEHLVTLGVTTLELMPVAEAITEPFLLDLGLTNNWGYSPINYFAPWSRYASSSLGTQIEEFRQMVDRLHQAGIEVVVDVVYNHTGEGGSGGPHLSFRGLDEAGWYRFTGDGHYTDWTGTGNTVDMTEPHVLDLTLSSLRWWVEGLGVDGFRFDLAVTLGRDPHAFSRAAEFFAAIEYDPVLSDVKLIAEPWDVGPDGYQVGNFPESWAEWNDAFRDDIRSVWGKGPRHMAGLATRLSGSQDRFWWKGPLRSINLITAHDGFTLRDVVSYDHRHNTANAEDNADGHGDNRSWNSGVEGPSNDPEVLDLRARRTRSMLAVLFCSQGVPMLLSGDELGNTQRGNNNAYAQDNELSWLDWEQRNDDLVSFVSILARIRRDHRTLRRSEWLEGSDGDHLGDITWLDTKGNSLSSDEWEPHRGGLIARYHGSATTPTESDLLLVFNTASHDQDITLPEGTWRNLADADPHKHREEMCGVVTRRGFTALILEQADS